MAERASPHFVDVDLTPTLVDALLRPHLYERCVAVERMPVGWNNLAARVLLEDPSGVRTDRLLRLSKATWPREKIENEVAALEVARAIDFGGVAVPQILAHGFAGEHGDFHWLLMDFLPGRNLEGVWRTLSLEDKERVLDGVAGIVRGLRSVRFPTIGGWKMAPSGPGIGPYFDGGFGPYAREAEYLLDRLEKRLSRVLSSPDAALAALGAHVSLMLPRIRAAVEALPHSDTVLFHGDLAFRNMLVVGAPGHARVSALLDWEWAGAMPAWCDFAGAEMLEPDGSPADEDEAARIREGLKGRELGVYEAAPGFRTREAVEGLSDALTLWRLDSGMDTAEEAVGRIQDKLDALLNGMASSTVL